MDSTIVLIDNISKDYYGNRIMIFNDLALFTTVARLLSYSAAAEELKVTPSLVSRRLSELETQLGYRLFERTTRQVRLTAEGQKLMDLCEAPVEALAGIIPDSFNSNSTLKGKVRITSPLLIARTWLWPLLKQYLTQHPDISIELLPSNDYMDFVRDEIDLAFRLGPLPSSELVALPLFRVNYHICVSTQFKRKNNLKKTISVEDLEKLPAITSDVRWMFLEKKDFKPPIIAHHLVDMELLQSAVMSGMGVGILPDSLLMPGIETIKVEQLTPVTREVYVVYPSRRLLPQRVRLLINWISENNRK